MEYKSKLRQPLDDFRKKEKVAATISTRVLSSTMGLEFKHNKDMNRDSKGRFVKGNVPTTQRDPNNGRYISEFKPVDKHTVVQQEVDARLKQLDKLMDKEEALYW